MAIFIPWLVDAARLTGYPVKVIPGWESLGHGGMRLLEGVVLHFTATPNSYSGDYPSQNIVRNGRADLAGPLSAYGIGRSGTIYVIAAGESWHAGASAWAGFTDLNDEFIGIEAENDNISGIVDPVQLDSYKRLVASVLYYMHRDSSRAAGHLEVALPEGRKSDPKGINLPSLRSDVAWMLQDPLKRIPKGGDDFMSALTDAEQRELYDNLKWIRGQLGFWAPGSLAVKTPGKDNMTAVDMMYAAANETRLKLPEMAPENIPEGTKVETVFGWTLASAAYAKQIKALVEQVLVQLKDQSDQLPQNFDYVKFAEAVLQVKAAEVTT